MRRLGKIMHITRRGTLILRVDKIPPIGKNSIVLNKGAKRIGVVVDVFGPVKHPYVAIKPDTAIDATQLVGQIVYLEKRK